ncbi:MAG: hypothetical protein R8K22_08410 [Mariprofundaceae bacterium]
MIQSLHPTVRMCLLLFAVSLFALAIRVTWIASEQLSLAEQALEADKNRTAIIAYERSIHAYLPLLPIRSDAISGIIALNQKVESDKDPILALEGWRRLRGALLSSRSTIFGQPNADILSEANLNIARLAAATDTQGRMTKEEIEKEALQLLTENPKDVSGFWGVMQFIFLMSWIGFTCRLIWIWADMTTPTRFKFITASSGSWLAWLGSLWMAG